MPSYTTISAGDVVGQMPSLPFGPSRAPFASLRLWKLHGSLAWWWVTGDRTGMTTARWPVDSEEQNSSTITQKLDTFVGVGMTQKAEPHEAETDRRRRLLPGRSRFIAPPLGMKSDYFQNPFMVQLWRNARRALENATEVYFVGYRLPPADTAARGLFRESIQCHARIFVVNPEPDQIGPQLRAWGFQDINYLSGDQCVEEMVEKIEIERAGELVSELTQLSNSSQIIFPEQSIRTILRVVNRGVINFPQLGFDRIEGSSLILRPIAGGNSDSQIDSQSGKTHGHTGLTVQDFFLLLNDHGIKEIKVHLDACMPRVVSFEIQKDQILDNGERFTINELWLAVAVF